MQSLTDLINEINSNFPQQSISLEVFDFKAKKKVVKPQPINLFRGERAEWPETKSTFSRNLFEKPFFSEVNYWLSGHHQVISEHRTNSYSLYYFIREAVFGLSPFDPTPDPNIEKSIVGIMQHYEFDTSFFDLTSDLTVVAYFATLEAEIGHIGQLMIFLTKSIEDKYFDLSEEVANRPKTQSSFVLYGAPELNLKSPNFIKECGALWRKFQVTKEDIESFKGLEVLSTKGDRIAQ